MLAALAMLAAGCRPAGPPPDPHTVFVSDERLNLLHVVDGVSMSETGRIPVGHRPRGMAASPPAGIDNGDGHFPAVVITMPLLHRRLR